MGELFDEYATSVYNHAYWVVGDWSAAEDVVSLTFMEVWRLRERLDPDGGSLRPWLLGVATNVGRNLRRARRLHREALAKVPCAAPVPDFADEVVGRITDAQRLENTGPRTTPVTVRPQLKFPSVAFRPARPASRRELALDLHAEDLAPPTRQTGWTPGPVAGYTNAALPLLAQARAVLAAAVTADRAAGATWDEIAAVLMSALTPPPAATAADGESAPRFGIRDGNESPSSG
ncbi:RNA polymerase sigma factor [Nonomuraea insulae]|uniref:RNA polymerase sigma factor n=1 Tax=Nonomuraea insulae TaxID=1616787 RepID=A0ABW1CG02_9ACTN